MGQYRQGLVDKVKVGKSYALLGLGFVAFSVIGAREANFRRLMTKKYFENLTDAELVMFEEGLTKKNMGVKVPNKQVN